MRCAMQCSSSIALTRRRRVLKQKLPPYCCPHTGRVLLFLLLAAVALAAAQEAGTPPAEASLPGCTSAFRGDRVATGSWGDTLTLDCGTQEIDIGCVWFGPPGCAGHLPNCGDDAGLNSQSRARGLCNHRNQCQLVAQVLDRSLNGIFTWFNQKWCPSNGAYCERSCPEWPCPADPQAVAVVRYR